MYIYIYCNIRLFAFLSIIAAAPESIWRSFTSAFGCPLMSFRLLEATPCLATKITNRDKIR